MIMARIRSSSNDRVWGGSGLLGVGRFLNCYRHDDQNIFIACNRYHQVTRVTAPLPNVEWPSRGAQFTVIVQPTTQDWSSEGLHRSSLKVEPPPPGRNSIEPESTCQRDSPRKVENVFDQNITIWRMCARTARKYA